MEVTGGGYRLSGRWSFGSGCTHADVISAGAVLSKGGVPLRGQDGQAQWRVALLPASKVEVHDTWHTTGLCGSGSHDYSIKDAFVPIGHTFDLDGPRREGTLYRWPGLFTANIVAVPLGAATDALESAMEILAGKVSLPDKGLGPRRAKGTYWCGARPGHGRIGSQLRLRHTRALLVEIGVWRRTQLRRARGAGRMLGAHHDNLSRRRRNSRRDRGIPGSVGAAGWSAITGT